MIGRHLEQHGAEIAGGDAGVPKLNGVAVATWQGVSVYSRLDMTRSDEGPAVCLHVSDRGVVTNLRLTPAAGAALAKNLSAALEKLELLRASMAVAA